VNTYLEDLVRDAQRRQAGRAVPPERILAKLPVRTTRRATVRRRGSLIVAAACAAGLAVASVPLAVRLDAPPDRPPIVAEGWSGVVPDFENLRPPEQVWPDAVHRLPATLPDGSTYSLQLSLGGGRYLVRGVGKNPGPAHNVGPKVFDTAAGTVQALGDPDAAGPDGTWLHDVAVDGDRAVWVLQQGAHQFDVWSAPLDGSAKARLAVRWTGPGVAYPIGLHAGSVYWATSVDKPATGIYRTPLSGGAPELVPDSAGFREYGQFPWVTPGPVINDLAVQQPPGAGARSGELLNLVTGERLHWTANPDARAVQCNPMLCVGWSADEKAVFQRLDGSAYTKLRYHQTVMWGEESALDGRFGVGTVQAAPSTSWIWDRATGAAASPPGARVELVGGAFPSTLAQWTDADGAIYALDLADIK